MLTAKKNIQLRKWADYRSIIFLCYSVIILIVMIFHEPWFDEAQAWLIARDSSLKDLLFVRPHYEGHPFFWHLILRIPAKLGLPYEASIKSINFIFAVSVVYLILYRSPFPKPVKIILPFSYFFLYQYGVISRPYAMLGCAMFLSAMAWKNRAEKPWRLSLALMFLCATSAYGIAIAGAFGIVWLFEKIKERSLFREKRAFSAMSVLVVFAGLLAADILPASNTVGLGTTTGGYSYISNLFLCFFMVPSEVLFTSYSEYVSLTFQGFSPFEIISGTLISLLVWYLILSFLHKRKSGWLFFLSYLFFSVIAARYLSVHHYGILLYLMLTVVWIGLDVKPVKESYSIRDMLSPLKQIRVKMLPGLNFREVLTQEHVIIFMMLCFVAVNAYWSGSAIVTDVQYNYGYGRMLADYITENQLDSEKALAQWTIKMDDDHEIESMDTNYVYFPVIEANAYFRTSLVKNRENGLTYEEHRIADDKENQANLERMQSFGSPDIVYADISAMLDLADILELDRDYHNEYVGEIHKVWKNRDKVDYLYIWVHNEAESGDTE